MRHLNDYLLYNYTMCPVRYEIVKDDHDWSSISNSMTPYEAGAFKYYNSTVDISKMNSVDVQRVISREMHKSGILESHNLFTDKPTKTMKNKSLGDIPQDVNDIVFIAGKIVQNDLTKKLENVEHVNKICAVNFGPNTFHKVLTVITRKSVYILDFDKYDNYYDFHSNQYLYIKVLSAYYATRCLQLKNISSIIVYNVRSNRTSVYKTDDISLSPDIFKGIIKATVNDVVYPAYYNCNKCELKGRCKYAPKKRDR